MKEDFVSFSLAKKLKEKGFRYNKNNLLDRLCMENQINHPPISQVLKWLREEKKMNVNMRLLVENGWYFSIQDYMGVQRYSILEDAKDTDDLYSSYEAAALAGIEFVIDNLI